MQKRLWLRYRPRARTRLPLKRMATLMPECLRQLVCRNYRTVWDRLCPVAHWRLIKEAPRSFAWPRRGSKWTKLSDKHFKEWPKERDELFNCTRKRASGCETKPRMPRGCATQPHPNNLPAATPKQFWHRTKVPSLCTEFPEQRSLPKCQYECAHHTSYYASFHPNTR